MIYCGFFNVWIPEQTLVQHQNSRIAGADNKKIGIGSRAKTISVCPFQSWIRCRTPVERRVTKGVYISGFSVQKTLQRRPLLGSRIPIWVVIPSLHFLNDATRQ
jgi:hypothetical protein